MEILRHYHSKVFYDEDGNALTIKTKIGASNEQINNFEKNKKIKLPDELRQLISHTNGVDIFGVSIHSLDEMLYFSEENFLTIHDWGNGDFDSISLNQENGSYKVYFLSHSVENNYFVCPSLKDWILNVIIEIEEKGTLLHPMDYLNSDENGLYKIISHKIFQ